MVQWNYGTSEKRTRWLPTIVLCREVVCSSEVQNVLRTWKMNIWGFEVCPL